MTSQPLRHGETQTLAAGDGSPMPDAPWTEDHVLAALYRHFTQPKNGGWAAIAQVTTHDDDGVTDDTALHRRADMLLVRRDRRVGVGLETMALEVKVSRYDFTREIANPDKQAIWREYATRHAYVAPPGIIREGETPEGSGYYEVERLVPSRADSPTMVNIIDRAPYEPERMGGLITSTEVSLLMRLAKAEADARGWGEHSELGNERELRAALKAAERAAAKAERDAINAAGKAEAWKTAFATAAPEGLPCRWCERPIKPLRPGKGWFGEWRHRDRDDDDPCLVLETVDRENLAKRAYYDAPEHVRETKLAQRTSIYSLREMFDYDAEPWRAFFDHTPRGPQPEIR